MKPGQPKHQKKSDQNELSVSSEEQKHLHRQPLCKDQFKDVVSVQRIERQQIEETQREIQADENTSAFVNPALMQIS